MAAPSEGRKGRDAFERSYRSALRRHVQSSKTPNPGSPQRLGRRACALGIETLALAGIHDAALSSLAPEAGTAEPRDLGIAARAAAFFCQAMGPIEAMHLPAVEARAERLRLGKSVDRGLSKLAASRKRLDREVARRRDVETHLAASVRKHRTLLLRSKAMEEELRLLSRSLLRSHEEERTRISRELHDALGQSLTAVNVGLASLRAAAAVDSKEFRGGVARTQRLVRQSMRTVHRFARSLRPTLLDDLGLVPALLAFAKEFGKRYGVDVQVMAPPEPDALDVAGRTALFRVAQEAFTNIHRHARARHARVTLRSIPGGVRMEVWNDGKTFDASRSAPTGGNRHLGILCMRERMEMVGGTLVIESSRRGGTIVRAEAPVGKVRHG
jgi:signal transduction histidine kinase